MPRATWKGFLRLSLVSCPVFLTPAVTKTKPIRLNQVWVPGSSERALSPRAETRGRSREVEEPETDPELDEPPQQWRVRAIITEKPAGPGSAAVAELPAPTRVALRPHDPHTGEEIDRGQVLKGYEVERGKFVTFTPEELKALEVESSKTIDLTTFVPRADIDPMYFNAPYYLYADGEIAAESYAVIAAAMAQAGMAGIGRLTLSRREHPVMVEPRGAGMMLMTLRATDEVRPAEFGEGERELDPEMVAIAETIIRRRAGEFDPSIFRDRHQDALRELIAAKTAGRTVTPKPAPAPEPVVDLMAMLKRSLAEETGKISAKPKRRTGDRRQTSLLLPVTGKRGKRAGPVATLRPRGSGRKQA